MPNRKIKLIARYRVRCMPRELLATQILSAIEVRSKRIILFANTNFIVHCRGLLGRINQRDCILVNDGVGMNIAALLIYGDRFKENLNGTDFTPYLFHCTPRPLRVFMVGGKPETLALAVRHVREQFKQDVVGYCDGYTGLHTTPDLVAQINQTQADVILVALGNPMQEKWIINQIDQADSGVFMGVGALFDFWAGSKVRAPTVVQKLNLEWLFRLMQEPKRLARRYTIDIVIFFYHCFKYRKSG